MTRKKDSGGWFKVHSSILEDASLDSVSAECHRFYFRLLAMLNRARSSDGKITLSRRGVNTCAMREQHRAALRIVREGVVAGLYTASEEGTHVSFEVSKWLIYNGMGSNSYTTKGTHQDQDQDQDQNQHLISPTKSPLGTPDGAPLEGEKLELVSLSDDPPGGFDMLHAEPDSTDSTDIEAEVFAEVRRLAGTFHHDRKPRAWRLTKQRRARMRAIAKEFGPTAPVDSFQGFVSYHLLGNRWPEQRANLNPETVWRPANVAKYLEQFSDSGGQPVDIHAPKKPKWAIQVERIARAEGLIS